MWGTRRKTITEVCVIGGLFVLAGCLRMADRVLPPLPSAICFLLTNLLYMGMAMAWGFSISHRVLQRSVRLNLLLGCGLAMLWLFMRAVKYRFFGSGTVGGKAAARMVWSADSRGAADCRRFEQRRASAGVSLCAVSGKRELYPRRTVYAGDDLGRRMDDGGCGDDF